MADDTTPPGLFENNDDLFVRIDRALRLDPMPAPSDFGFRLGARLGGVVRPRRPDTVEGVVDLDLYPVLTKALRSWWDISGHYGSDPLSGRVAVRGRFGPAGLGGCIEHLHPGTGLAFFRDSWVPALVVLAASDDHMREKTWSRSCPRCRGRGTADLWHALPKGQAPAVTPPSMVKRMDEAVEDIGNREQWVEGQDGVFRYFMRFQCSRCSGSKSVSFTLLDVVFAAAQGWPWALRECSVIADQLQAKGEWWGTWLAALLEPRAWGDWWSHPTRKAVEFELAERLDELVEAWRVKGVATGFQEALSEFGAAAGRHLLPATQAAAQAIAGLGVALDQPHPRSEVSTGYTVDIHAAISRSGVTVYDLQPPQENQFGEFREMDVVWDPPAFDTLLGRPVIDENPESPPVIPPIGDRLARRLDRGRRRR